ncbi:MAG: hypothetical protein ACYC3P_03935 [Bellilinea sp.]
MKEMIFKVDDIQVELAEENKGIRLTTQNNDNVILQNQTMTSVENIVRENFEIVKSHYQAKLGVAILIDERNLGIISLKIVLHYLYIYNMWKKAYKDHKDQDLVFLAEDFESPSTGDMIIWYFKNEYPENYSAKCELMLAMSADEFKAYEKRRQEFHDMW